MLIVALITSLLFAGTTPSPAEGYGRASFSNSGAPAAQADFSEGMALLHDFEYPAAATAFQRAQAADPGFAMAYWGEAMPFNHPLGGPEDLAATRAALDPRSAPSSAPAAAAKTD